MNHVKKSLILFITVVLLSSLFLGACSKPNNSGNSNTNDKKTEKSQNEKEEKGKLEPVELRIVVHGDGKQPDHDMVVDAIEEYLKEDLNVSLNIDIISFGGEQDDLILTSGEKVDLMFQGAWTNYNVHVAKGAFLELDDLLEKHGQDILNAEYNYALEAGKFEGKQYAIPSHQMMAQQRGIMMRRDLMEKYASQADFELKEMNNLEDLEPLLKVVKENEPDMTPIIAGRNRMLEFPGAWDNNGFSDPAAIDIIKGEPKVVNYFASDYYKERMELARRWFTAGYINKDAATYTENTETPYAAKKAFSHIAITNWDFNTVNVEKRTNLPTVNFQSAPNVITTATVQGALFTIPATSENPERAMMFLNRLHTDEKLQNMLIYGLEDTHYVKVDGNIIDVAPGINPTNHPYKNPQYWMWGNQALLYPFKGEDPNYSEKLKAFNNTALSSPALGFVWNTDNVKNEVAATSNVVAEFYMALSSGSIDPYETGMYDKFLEKLDDAGVDKLIEDKQRQLDEWLKQQ